MIPQEKAKELVDNHYAFIDLEIMALWSTKDKIAKECALFTVEEILEMDLPILEENADTFYDYWKQVKQEIQQL